MYKMQWKKDESKFHKDRYREDGLRIYCKSCRSTSNSSKANKQSSADGKSKEKLAYFYGLFAGDGAFFKHGRSRKLALYCNINDEKIIKNCYNLLSYFYNKEKVKKQNRDKRSLVIIYVFDKYANNYFNIGVGKKKNTNFKIPEWILKREKYSKKCLKGLIETDGHIRKVHKGNGTYYTCSFTNSNRDIFKGFLESAKKCGYQFNEHNSEKNFDCSLSKTDKVRGLISDLNLFHKIKEYSYD